MGTSVGEKALAALANNDVDTLLNIFRSGADVDAVVKSGAYLGCSSFGHLLHKDGDTMLHLAMRNEKWPIRQACVVELVADATLRNCEGESAPDMQLIQSGPRTAVCAAVVALQAYFEFLYFGRTAFYVSCAVLAVAAFDLQLALRWKFVAHSNKGKGRAKGAARKQQSKQGEASTNCNSKGSSKKQR